MSGEPGKDRYGLIGYPVSHSMSPAIFAAAFEAEGISASYDLFPISPDELEKGFRKLVREGVRGLNVTIPHKTAVLPRMDRLDESARLTGAVNTVAFTAADGAVGHNTDVGGFGDSFGPLGVPELRGEKVLVLGAGGAARAVVVALALRKAARIVIANRFIEKAENLLSAVAPHFPSVKFGISSLEAKEVSAAAAGVVLCVQATSLGLNPEDPLPMDPAVLPKGCFFYDLVYGPRDTPWVRAARASGYRSADGKEMLLRQAARAFVIWVGREAPVKNMRTAMNHWIERAT